MYGVSETTREVAMPAQPERQDQSDYERMLHDLAQTAAELPNVELLAAVDVVLLDLEKRLLHYSRVGPEMVPMADEGLVLAVRAGARLRQAQSAVSHSAGHLQVVGVGTWRPKSTNPSWSDDARVVEDEGS
jgi:hypothetical protein